MNRELGPTGVLFTPDALHCKKTFEAARDTGNALIAQVKANQQILHETLEAIAMPSRPPTAPRQSSPFVIANSSIVGSRPSTSPAAQFEACDKVGTRVSLLSLVRYRGNDYSVPVSCGHQAVCHRSYVHEVVIGCGA